MYIQYGILRGGGGSGGHSRNLDLEETALLVLDHFGQGRMDISMHIGELHHAKLAPGRFLGKLDPHRVPGGTAAHENPQETHHLQLALTVNDITTQETLQLADEGGAAEARQR